jgi:hypothetical protein
MPTVHRSTTEQTALPDWLYAPASIRLAAAAGMRFELENMTVVSNDDRRKGALIGVLRNRSRAISGATLTLSYIGADGESSLRTAVNTAAVTEVPADGLLPFRFPLLASADVPGDVAGLELVIQEHAGGARKTVLASMRGGVSIRTRPDETRQVAGLIEITDSTWPRADGSSSSVTLLIHDSKGKLLEILAGAPRSTTGNELTIELASYLALPKRVGRVDVYVETDR